MSRRWPLAAALVAAVASVAALPAVRGPFFVDDLLYLGDPALRNVPLAEAWRLFLRRANQWEYLPLRDLSYRVDLALFGADPFGWHVHNLLLHVACTAALAALALRLARAFDHPAPAWLAAAAAALFAAHPAHVESVAWISGRKDLLSGLFGLLALERLAARKDVAGVVLFALALLAKSTVLPLVVVAWWIARKDGRPRAAIPWVAVAAAGVALHVAVGRGTGVASTEALVRADLGRAEAPFVVLGALARIALAPVDLRLVWDLGPGEPLRLYAWAFAAGAIGALGWAARARTLPRLGVAAAVVCCAPFLQIVPFTTWSLASERFLFLPVAGLAIAGAAALPRPVALAIAAALTAASVSRARLWADPVALSVDAAAKAPRHEVAVDLAVDHLVANARWDEATLATEALRDDATRVALAGYVAVLRADAEGDRAALVAALPGLLATCDALPDGMRARVGAVALTAGFPEAAVPVLARIAYSRPHLVGARYDLGLALEKLGRREEAAREVRAAVEGGLPGADAHNKLGSLEKALGRAEAAEAAFRDALAADPRHWHAAWNLAGLFAARGRTAEARAALAEARRRAILAGEPPDVHARLEGAVVSLGQ
ncbi:MAG: hypothetical protein ACOZNI_35045 [Myxococcota bacterium]